MKNENLLFEVPQQLSPRLAWIAKHKITTRDFPGVKMGDEDEFGNDLYPWTAFSGRIDALHAHVGGGATEDDAIADYARKRGMRLWNEENL